MAGTQLEIVVKGRRQSALSTQPHRVGPAFLGNGFVIEEHHMNSFEMPDHWIPNYLVTLSFSPQRSKRFYFEAGRERETVIEAGSCDVVAPCEMRKFRFKGEARAILLSIEPEILQSMIAGPSGGNALELIRRWHGADPILQDLLMKLRAEVQGGFPAGALLSEHLCTKLAEQLIERHSIGKLKVDRYKGGLSGFRLSQVIEFIDSHLELNLTAGELARVAGLSKYHFGKAFSASIGMSPHRFMLARRIDRSRSLLVHSGLPLAQIAAAVGFSSQSHFTTVFLERIGATPGRYRSTRRPVSVAFDS